MKYEEWIENINVLKERNNEIILNKLLNEPTNDVIISNISKKIKELIDYRFAKTKNKLIQILDEYTDENEFDILMINIKKEFEFTYKLTNINNLEDKEEVKYSYKNSVEDLYNVLIKDLNYMDDTGSLSLIAKNNRIKWSD